MGMTLKLIPFENAPGNSNGGGPSPAKRGDKKQKSFNPGGKIKKKLSNNESPFKKICLQLVHFVNRGSKFTYEQIDELIVSLHHSILSLQKKKHEMLKEKNGRLKK